MFYDFYKKIARPSVIYCGVGIALFNYCIFPFIAFLMGKIYSDVNIPTEFWACWAAVSSTYVYGRSKYDKKTEVK